MVSYSSRLQTAAQYLTAPSSAADHIYIMENNSFTPSFPTARPVSLKVRHNAKLAEHPLEDGSTISEHLVLNPIIIEISMIFIQKYRDTYAKMKTDFQQGTLFTIQTKTHNYSNMVITSLPHEEKTEYWDVILVNLTFQEARLIQNSLGILTLNDVKNSSDVSSVNMGSLQAENADILDRNSVINHFINIKI